MSKVQQPRTQKPRAQKPRAWQRMLSGRRLDLLDPSALDIEIEDIALGLARVARWNGQTEGEFAFSVAQHSVLVSQLCTILDPKTNNDILRAALLHDAAEYVMGDIISPFKSVMGGNYKDMENSLLFAIHLRFELPGNLPNKWSNLIKKADQTAAFLEAIHLAGFTLEEAKKYFKQPKIALDEKSLKENYLEPWTPKRAQTEFTQQFQACYSLPPLT